uniref:PPPDE domain-containing protein n=1 Tax=Alexandrium andersonii TaxID=327968 RepID=A0A7S2CEA5_9DINO
MRAAGHSPIALRVGFLSNHCLFSHCPEGGTAVEAMGNTDCHAIPSPPASPSRKGHKVQLAVTALNPYVPTMQAYHTSLAVDTVEFSFSQRGVVTTRNFQSHTHLSGGPHQIIELGTTSLSGAQMARALRPHFKEQTYDLLRKNCNSFTDCAMFYLLGRRLDAKYYELEQIANSADRLMGIVRVLSLGDYKPNPRANAFDLEELIGKLMRLPEDKENVAVRGCYKPGQHVEVLSKMHSGWVGATVLTVTKAGTITVLYEGGEHRKDIPQREVENVLRPFNAAQN